MVRLLVEQLDTIGGPGTGAAKAQRLLLPVDTIDLGTLIHLILEIAEFRRQEVETDTDTSIDTGEAEGRLWERRELLDYLKDTTTSQKVLLGALVGSGEHDWVSRNQLLHLMAKVTTVVPGTEEHDEVTGYWIAGARAGLKMRRGDKEDIIEQKGKSYRLKSDYRKIVTEWAEDEGLLEPLKDETL